MDPLKRDLTREVELSNLNMRKKLDKNETAKNMKREEHRFEIGEWILIRENNLSNKLAAYW